MDIPEELYDDGTVVPDASVLCEGVERASESGVEAVDFRPWDHPERDRLMKVVRDNGLDIAYVSGRDEYVPLTNPERTEAAIEEIRDGIAVAESVGAANVNVKTGPERHDLDAATQFENVVAVLQEVAPTAADAGVTLVLEPVNDVTESPPMFVRTAEQAHRVVTAVDHPGVQILFDAYHEQIMSGDLIRTIRTYADAIGHVHVADVAGRHQPGTGEIVYESVLDALAAVGYDRYVGFEFYPTGDPDAAIEQTLAKMPGTEGSGEPRS
jgi:hydroxypyruvate isomerase